MVRFKVVGAVAHTNPKVYIDVTRIVRAKDPIHAMEVWQERLRGVKKKKVYLVEPVGRRYEDQVS